MAIDMIFLAFTLIHLLTSFSKVLEKVIYTRIYQHISQSNILLNEQYGCSRNSSTENVSCILINEILFGRQQYLSV